METTVLATLAGKMALGGMALAALAVDGQLAGHLLLADAVRPETPLALERLRQAGIKRIVLASGDSQPVVDRVG